MQTDGYQHLLSHIGSQIRQARKAHGLSQEQLAEQVDMDRVSIGYIEQARRAPSMKALYVIAESLDVGISYFFMDFNDDSLDS